MARKQTLDAIVALYQKLGGNLSEVLGTKTNINFLGKGSSPELMLDMDINPEALAILPQSKAVEELTSSVGYAVSNKLNDIQANQLLKNMQKMDSLYFPPAAPANITDMVTGTRGLDKRGLESLRVMAKDLPPPGSRGGADDIAAPIVSPEDTFKNTQNVLREQINKLAADEGVDAAETILPTGAGLEALKNVKNNNLIVNEIVNKIYLNAGVSANAQPVVRANAREFLNRVKDLEDPNFPGGTTLSSIMEADDFKFMTEGGGGGMGDPFLLVQKYFGPKVAAAVAKLDGPNDIQLFAERLVSVTDDAGRTITDRRFNPETVDIDDFEFADGGRVAFKEGGGADARYMFIPPKFLTMKGISEDPSLKVGGFGLDKHDTFYDKFGKFLSPLYYLEKLLEKRNKVKKADGGIARLPMFMGGAARMGYQALRRYGFEAKDITRMFKELAVDKSLQGKEKTLYFQTLNKALKNPEEFPDTIKEMQLKLGIDVGTGFKSGGLAGILEV